MTNPISVPVQSLIVDKISITRAGSRSNLVQHAQTEIEAIVKANRTSFRSTNYYAIDAKITIPVSRGIETLHLQIGPRDSKISAYRAEFNPAKLGPAGLAVVDTLLLRVTGLSLHEFVAEGTVTRLDIAIDLPGITVNDIIARQKSVRKIGSFSDQHGEPETLYLGSTQPTSIYNKRVTRSAAVSSLRIERRLRPRRRGADLFTLQDPFKGLTLIPTAILTEPLADTNIPPDMFLAYARQQGLQRASEMLPKPVQRKIKAALLDSANSTATGDVWRQWPATLESSGLLPERSSSASAVAKPVKKAADANTERQDVNSS